MSEPKESNENLGALPGYASFLDLPIVFDAEEVNSEGWRRRTTRRGTVRELLEIWDIDDESETSEMAQVLRHLRTATGCTDEVEGSPIGWSIVGIGKDGSILCQSPTGKRRRYWLNNDADA